MLNRTLAIHDVPDVERHVSSVIVGWTAKHPQSRLSNDDRDDLHAYLLAT